MQGDGIITRTPSFFPIQSPKPTSLFPSNHVNFTTQTRFMKTGFIKATQNGSLKPITEMNFYEHLDIPESVNLCDIKRAYKQLARKYHPDVSPPHLVDEYTQRFIIVQQAYETLSDPIMRDLYDRDLARGLHLAYSARKMVYSFDQETEDKSNWRNRWQDQLSGLKRRSMQKDYASKSMSWGARMRQQRNESSPET